MIEAFTLDDETAIRMGSALRRHLEQQPAGNLKSDPDLRLLAALGRKLQEHEASRSSGTTLFRSGDGGVHIAGEPRPIGGLWLTWTATNWYHHGTFEAGLEPEEVVRFRADLERVLTRGRGEAKLGGDSDSAMLETRWFSNADSWWFVWKLTIMSDGSVTGGLWGESRYGTTADLQSLISTLREREATDANG